jgi:hypothetical protein
MDIRYLHLKKCYTKSCSMNLYEILYFDVLTDTILHRGSYF